MTKLEKLAADYGFDNVMDMLEEATECLAHCFRIAPAICINSDCDYTTDMEPDQDRGWCEECETNTVQSCLILAGII